MSIDELSRSFDYIIIIFLAPVIATRVWNAVVMPDELRRPVAVFLWLQAAIYALFMVGLILLRLWEPVPWLVWVNTIFIKLQMLTVVIVAVRMSRLHAARLIQALTLGFVAMFLGGSK